MLVSIHLGGLNEVYSSLFELSCLLDGASISKHSLGLEHVCCKLYAASALIAKYTHVLTINLHIIRPSMWSLERVADLPILWWAILISLDYQCDVRRGGRFIVMQHHGSKIGGWANVAFAAKMLNQVKWGCHQLYWDGVKTDDTKVGEHFCPLFWPGFEQKPHGAQLGPSKTPKCAVYPKFSWGKDVLGQPFFAIYPFQSDSMCCDMSCGHEVAAIAKAQMRARRHAQIPQFQVRVQHWHLSVIGVFW